jgi:hypothetical protein
MLVTLRYQGQERERDSVFVRGKHYCFQLEELLEMGYILLKGQRVSVAYRDWPAFHSEWQLVEGTLPPP